MIGFFFKNRVLFVKIFIFGIVSFIVSKEIFLLNEELLLIIAFLLFLFAIFDIFSVLLKNELDSRAENIIITLDKLLAANITSFKYLNEIFSHVLWTKFYCFTIYSKVKKAQKKLEHYTLVNNNKKLQKYIVNYELRILFLEQIIFLKDYYFNSVSRLESEFLKINPELEDFTEAQIDALTSVE